MKIELIDSTQSFFFRFQGKYLFGAKRKKSLASQRAQYWVTIERYREIKKWRSMLNHWDINTPSFVFPHSLDEQLRNAYVLLMKNKFQDASMLLIEANKVLDAIENEHSAGYQKLLEVISGFVKYTMDIPADTLCHPKDGEWNKEQTDLTELLNECKTTLDPMLCQYYAEKAQRYIENIIDERQTQLANIVELGYPAAALSRLTIALDELPHVNGICRSYSINDIQRLFHAMSQSNNVVFKLAVFGSAACLEVFFSLLTSRRVQLKEESQILASENDSVSDTILWRLNLARDITFYIVGFPTGSIINHHVGSDVLNNFSAVLMLPIDDLTATMEESVTILTALMSFPCDRVIVAGASAVTGGRSDAFFLNRYLTRFSGGNYDILEDITEWMKIALHPPDEQFAALQSSFYLNEREAL